MKALIEQLYDEKDCEIIKTLYKEKSNKYPLMLAIGQGLIEKNNLTYGNILDQILLMLSTCPFATEDEQLSIGVIIYSEMKSTDILPSLEKHRNIQFSAKALVSLSWFLPKLKNNYIYHGAPHPSYYRQVSKLYFRKNNLIQIAKKHEMFERFLFENFMVNKNIPTD